VDHCDHRWIVTKSELVNGSPLDQKTKPQLLLLKTGKGRPHRSTVCVCACACACVCVWNTLTYWCAAWTSRGFFQMYIKLLPQRKDIAFVLRVSSNAWESVTNV